MGYRFELEDANLIGWLTWGEARPRSFDEPDVERLLRNLEYSSDDVLISADPHWRHMINHEARRLASRLRERAVPFDVALQELRGIFGHFPLYALLLGPGHEVAELESFLRHYAQRQDLPALFLCPRTHTDAVDIFAPFPAITTGVANMAAWPGLVFWTPTGWTQFVSLRDAERALELLRHLPFDPHPYRYRHPPFDPHPYRYRHPPWLRSPDVSVSREIQEELRHLDRPRPESPRLLHLSDLHFGTAAARKRRTYLCRAIEELAATQKLKQAVITGDLFDNPTEDAAEHFFDFRDRLKCILRRDPIVVPGNHDSKHLGNLAPNYRELAQLMWTDVAVESELQTVFLCFDSSRDADLACGRVTPDQRMRIATRLQAVVAEQPSIRGYLLVAVLHHHPFSFSLPPRGFWKLLAKMGLAEERFLRMEDGEDFVKWCAKRGVPLVLHGHKHVPNHARGQIHLNGTYRGVDAIGCGSSTGVGDYPLSLNVLTWNEAERKWTAAFYSDPGDGSGFEIQRIKVSDVRVGAEQGE